MLLLTDTDLPSTIIANNTGLSSYPDTELLKINSISKREELFAILDNVDPGHYDRLNLVRFLGYVGYSFQEVCDIIFRLNSWGNYSENMTYNQVKSVFKWLKKPHTTALGTSHFNPSCERSEHGAWFKHEDWNKLYGKRMCTLHYVNCKDCPDNSGIPGESCKGRV